MVPLVISVTWDTSLQKFDLLAEFMLLLFHFVDASDQFDVVLHEARVVLTVLLEGARQLLAVVADVSLVSVPLACLCIVSFDISLAVCLFKHPGLVKPNDALLKLFVVSDVLDNFEDVTLESISLQKLHVKLVTAVQVLILETFVSHLEIVDDQVQVVANTLEMLNLNLHLVDLLVQRRNVVFSGQNISLELLDFVIKHEFELFKLLSFLLKLNNAIVFVVNSSTT